MNEFTTKTPNSNVFLSEWRKSAAARTEVKLWMNVHASEYATLLKCGSARRKLVFKELAAFCHPDTLACFPGQKGLSQRCELSDRQVRRILAELEDADLIRRMPQFNEYGGRMTDSYQIVGLDEFLSQKHLSAEAAWKIAHDKVFSPSGQPNPDGSGQRVPGRAGQRVPAALDNVFQEIRKEKEDITTKIKRTTKNDENAAPEIALASPDVDADFCDEDSHFPEGPFVRCRSMTAAERAEPLNVIRRSEVDADTWKRLTHPGEYISDYEFDPEVGEAI